MATITWKGVYPALLTPFKEDDSIDFELYEKNLQAQIEAGVDGIILGGSLGEASSLLNEEKKALLLLSNTSFQYSSYHQYCRANHQSSYSIGQRI
jgi:4-hydroxy-tetrahydrodipicolinate synthase